MLIFEKFRIEGARARARLQGTTDLPGSCDKMRGAEIISAAAGSASRSSEKRGSVRFAHAHAKRKHSTRKKRRAGGPNFEPEHPLARSDILHGNKSEQNS